MTPCNELEFQQLSDWVDRETPPPQSRVVEDHLSRCAACRSTVAQLGSLATVVEKAAPPPLRPRFAERTAARIREQGSGVPWLRRAVLSFGRCLSAWPLEASPLGRLISARAERKQVSLPGFGTVLLLYALPAVFFSLANPMSEMLRIYLTVMAIALLVGLPVYYFRTEVSILTSLRRGRCLEEMLCAGLSARRMVDTLAHYSAGSIARVGFPIVLVLLGSAALLPDSTVMLASLLWLPGVLLFFWTGSYVVQFMIAWSRNGEQASVPQVALGAAVFIPAVALAAVPRWLGLELAGTLAVVGLAAVWVVSSSRGLAIWGLENSSTVERWSRRRRARARSSSAASSENPIVAREAGPASSLGLGLAWVGAAAWYLSVLQRPVPMVSDPSPFASEGFFWLSLAAGGLLVFLRFADATLPSVVGEKEQRTWETLLQTGLSREEFVRGWTEVAVRPALRMILPFGLAAVALGVTSPFHVTGVPPSLYRDIAPQADPVLGLALGLGATLVLALLALAGARTGLALSATSSDAREASVGLFKWVAGGVAGLLTGWGVLAAASSAVAEQGLLDSSSLYWEIYLQQGLPLFLVGLLSLLAIVGSRRALSQTLSHLGVGGELRPAGAGLWGGVKLLVVPGFFAGLCAATTLGLSLLPGACYSTRTELVVLAASALGGSLFGAILCWLLPAGVVGCVGRCRKRWWNAWLPGLVGAVSGLLAFEFLCQALAVVPLIESRFWRFYPIDLPDYDSAAPGLLMGLVLGVVAGLREWCHGRRGAAIPRQVADSPRSIAWRALVLLGLAALISRAAVVPVRDPEALKELRSAQKPISWPNSWPETPLGMSGAPGIHLQAVRSVAVNPEQLLWVYIENNMLELERAMPYIGREDLRAIASFDFPEDYLLAWSDGVFRRQLEEYDDARRPDELLSRRWLMTRERNRYVNWYLQARGALFSQSRLGLGAKSPELAHLEAVGRAAAVLEQWRAVREQAEAQLRKP